MNTIKSLLLPSTEEKHAWASIEYKSTLLPRAKTPNCMALFISPDDYDIIVNRKENANVLLLLMLHISQKQPPASVL